MIGEVLGKALVVVKGDTSHARAEIAKLSAEEQKAAKARIKAQEDVNSAIDKGIQQYSLYGAAAATAFQIAKKGYDDYRDDWCLPVEKKGDEADDMNEIYVWLPVEPFTITGYRVVGVSNA